MAREQYPWWRRAPRTRAGRASDGTVIILSIPRPDILTTLPYELLAEIFHPDYAPSTLIPIHSALYQHQLNQLYASIYIGKMSTLEKLMESVERNPTLVRRIKSCSLEGDFIEPDGYRADTHRSMCMSVLSRVMALEYISRFDRVIHLTLHSSSATCALLTLPSLTTLRNQLTCLSLDLDDLDFQLLIDNFPSSLQTLVLRFEHHPSSPYRIRLTLPSTPIFISTLRLWDGSIERTSNFLNAFEVKELDVEFDTLTVLEMYIEKLSSNVINLVLSNSASRNTEIDMIEDIEFVVSQFPQLHSLKLDSWHVNSVLLVSVAKFVQLRYLTLTCCTIDDIKLTTTAISTSSLPPSLCRITIIMEDSYDGCVPYWLESDCGVVDLLSAAAAKGIEIQGDVWEKYLVAQAELDEEDAVWEKEIQREDAERIRDEKIRMGLLDSAEDHEEWDESGNESDFEMTRGGAVVSGDLRDFWG